MLLGAGADVNSQGGFYTNPLYAASQEGHEKVVQILLDAGADVHAKGGKNRSAFYAAASGRHEKVTQILQDALKPAPAQGMIDFSSTEKTRGYRGAVKRQRQT